MMYAKRLKQLRERIGISQKELANLINIQRPVYTQYENEYTTIPLIHLNYLCNYFSVSLDYIFDFTDLYNYEIIIKDIDKKVVGERLREFRKENKLTQVKLASMLNTTHSVIADYERGRFLISLSFLYVICKKYNISADYLLGKVDEPKYLKGTT